MNSCDHLILIFQFRLFGCDQTKYNFFVRRHFCKRCKTTGSFIVILQKQCIHMLLRKHVICHGVVWAAGKECRVIISAADVGSDHHILRSVFECKVIHL